MNSPQEKSFKNFSKHVFGKLLLNKFFSRNTPNTFCEEKKNECWLIWVDPVDSIKKMEVKQKASEQKDLASTHSYHNSRSNILLGLKYNCCFFNVSEYFPFKIVACLCTLKIVQRVYFLWTLLGKFTS